MTTTPADIRHHDTESFNDEAAQVLELARRERRQHPSVYRGPIDQGPTTSEQARTLARYLHDGLAPMSAGHIADIVETQFGPDEWARVAVLAGVQKPTTGVQALIVANLRARQNADDRNSGDPFAGLPGGAA